MALDIFYIPPSSDGGLVRRARVLLPADIFPGEYNWVLVKGSPDPTPPGGLFPKYVPPTHPFIERPEEATLLFQFFSDESRSLSMIVHRRSLLKLLPPREHFSDTDADTELQPIHWDKWSSDVALFDTTSNRTFITGGKHGQKSLLYQPPRTANTPYSILDFNPYRARQARATDPRTPVLHEAGSLPYAVTKLPEEHRYDVVYMSGSGLLGVNVGKSLYLSVVSLTNPTSLPGASRLSLGLQELMFYALGDVQQRILVLYSSVGGCVRCRYQAYSMIAECLGIGILTQECKLPLTHFYIVRGYVSALSVATLNDEIELDHLNLSTHPKYEFHTGYNKSE